MSMRTRDVVARSKLAHEDLQVGFGNALLESGTSSFGSLHRASEKVGLSSERGRTSSSAIATVETAFVQSQRRALMKSRRSSS